MMLAGGCSTDKKNTSDTDPGTGTSAGTGTTADTGGSTATTSDSDPTVGGTVEPTTLDSTSTSTTTTGPSTCSDVLGASSSGFEDPCATYVAPMENVWDAADPAKDPEAGAR